MAHISGFHFTTGSIADKNENVLPNLCRNMFGKLHTDKGYILNPEKFGNLFKKGIRIVSKNKKQHEKPTYGPQ